MQKNKKRNFEMVKLYKTHTYNEIGALHGISGERVRQILKRMGVTYEGSARQLAITQGKQKRLENYQNKIDKNTIQYYGVPRHELKKLPKDRSYKIRKAYQITKKNSRKLKVPFNLTVIEFWDIWKKSRKFNQRGRTIGQYTLARKDFKKGYVADNLQIEKCSDVLIRAVKEREKNKRKATKKNR